MNMMRNQGKITPVPEKIPPSLLSGFVVCKDCGKNMVRCYRKWCDPLKLVRVESVIINQSFICLYVQYDV